MVDTADETPVVRAINVAEVYPEYTRAAYEKRVRKGDVIPMSLTNHINIAIPIRPEIVALVRRANAFAATLPVSERALVASAPVAEWRNTTDAGTLRRSRAFFWPLCVSPVESRSIQVEVEARAAEGGARASF